MASLEMTLADLSADLEQRALRLDRPDFTAAMRACSLAVKASVMDNFAGQHDPEGKPWAPLKRQRNRKRDKRARKKGGIQQILLDTGLLRASYQSGGHHVEQVTPLSLEVGSNVEYAAAHQWGYPLRNLPARPMIGWNGPLMEVVSEIMADAFERGMVGD